MRGTKSAALISSRWMPGSPRSGSHTPGRREAGDAPGRRVAARPVASDRVIFPPGELAVPAHRRRGTNRVSTADQARPAGSYRTRLVFRRITAFSCRSNSSSAPFAWSGGMPGTVRPGDQGIIRKMILRDPWSASHHRALASRRNRRPALSSSSRAAQHNRPCPRLHAPCCRGRRPRRFSGAAGRTRARPRQRCRAPPWTGSGRRGGVRSSARW